MATDSNRPVNTHALVKAAFELVAARDAYTKNPGDADKASLFAAAIENLKTAARS